jgi:hypothetical protein
VRPHGIENPQWHGVGNLPGFRNRNIRAIGRNVFGALTRTPHEEIVTIANVGGQGPNTTQEVNAVAQWIRDNGQRQGDMIPDFGMAIPGYEPEIVEYVVGNVRFQIVRDPMGSYIYAWPEADTTQRGAAGPALPGDDNDFDMPEGGGMRRLRESGSIFDTLSLYENVKFDMMILDILKESAQGIEEDTLEESTLSRLLGRKPGSKNLVSWLHKRGGLSNEAYLVPQPLSTRTVDRLLWGQFKADPYNFIIISGENGVAAVKPNQASYNERKAKAEKAGKQYNPSGDTGLLYEVIAFKDDGTRVDPELLRPSADRETQRTDADGNVITDPTVYKARMGLHTGSDRQNPDNMFNLLNDQIGPLTTIWISTGTQPTEFSEPTKSQRDVGFYGQEPRSAELVAPGDVEGEHRGYQFKYPAGERGKQAFRKELKTSPLSPRMGGAGKLEFPSEVRPAEALEQAVDRIFTPDRLRKIIGSGIARLIQSRRRAQDAGNLDRDLELGQRIKKLKDLQDIELARPWFDNNIRRKVKAAIVDATRKQAQAELGETPNMNPDQRAAAVEELRAAIIRKLAIPGARGTMGMQDVYVPIFRQIIDDISRSGLPYA